MQECNNSHLPICVLSFPAKQALKRFVVLVGFTIALCSASSVLPDANNTDRTCIPESNISLYNQLYMNTVTFPEVRVNFTLDQILENSIPYRARLLLSSVQEMDKINFIAQKDQNASIDMCKRIGKLSPHSTFISTYKCPWEYKCDYDPHRIPQVLWQANCKLFSKWGCSCSDDGENCNDCTSVPKSCVPVYYPVSVLYTSNCSPYDTHGTWKWRQEKVAVSCACSNENAYS